MPFSEVEGPTTALEVASDPQSLSTRTDAVESSAGEEEIQIEGMEVTNCLNERLCQ